MSRKKASEAAAAERKTRRGGGDPEAEEKEEKTNSASPTITESRVVQEQERPEEVPVSSTLVLPDECPTSCPEVDVNANAEMIGGGKRSTTTTTEGNACVPCPRNGIHTKQSTVFVNLFANDTMVLEVRCFACKRDVLINPLRCSREGCHKVYHPECVGESIKRGNNSWTCHRHSCFVSMETLRSSNAKRRRGPKPKGLVPQAPSAPLQADVNCLLCPLGYNINNVPETFLDCLPGYGLCPTCVECASWVRQRSLNSSPKSSNLMDIEIPATEKVYKIYMEAVLNTYYFTTNISNDMTDKKIPVSQHTLCRIGDIEPLKELFTGGCLDRSLQVKVQSHTKCIEDGVAEPQDPSMQVKEEGALNVQCYCTDIQENQCSRSMPFKGNQNHSNDTSQLLTYQNIRRMLITPAELCFFQNVPDWKEQAVGLFTFVDKLDNVSTPTKRKAKRESPCLVRIVKVSSVAESGGAAAYNDLDDTNQAPAGVQDNELNARKPSPRSTLFTVSDGLDLYVKSARDLRAGRLSYSLTKETLKRQFHMPWLTTEELKKKVSYLVATKILATEAISSTTERRHLSCSAIHPSAGIPRTEGTSKKRRRNDSAAGKSERSKNEKKKMKELSISNQVLTELASLQKQTGCDFLRERGRLQAQGADAGYMDSCIKSSVKTPLVEGEQKVAGKEVASIPQPNTKLKNYSDDDTSKTWTIVDANGVQAYLQTLPPSRSGHMNVCAELGTRSTLSYNPNENAIMQYPPPLTTSVNASQMGAPPPPPPPPPPQCVTKDQLPSNQRVALVPPNQPAMPPNRLNPYQLPYSVDVLRVANMYGMSAREVSGNTAAPTTRGNGLSTSYLHGGQGCADNGRQANAPPVGAQPLVQEPPYSSTPSGQLNGYRDYYSSAQQYVCTNGMGNNASSVGYGIPANNTSGYPNYQTVNWALPQHISSLNARTGEVLKTGASQELPPNPQQRALLGYSAPNARVQVQAGAEHSPPPGLQYHTQQQIQFLTSQMHQLQQSLVQQQSRHDELMKRLESSLGVIKAATTTTDGNHQQSLSNDARGP